MAFRRAQKDASEASDWRRFVRDNRELLAKTGVPQSLCESRALFDDLLMHGYVHHHPDPTEFSVAELSPAQRAALIEAIVRYLRAGFADPGLAIFGTAVHEDIRRRATLPAG